MCVCIWPKVLHYNHKVLVHKIVKKTQTLPITYNKKRVQKQTKIHKKRYYGANLQFPVWEGFVKE